MSNTNGDKKEDGVQKKIRWAQRAIRFTGCVLALLVVLGFTKLLTAGVTRLTVNSSGLQATQLAESSKAASAAVSEDGVSDEANDATFVTASKIGSLDQEETNHVFTVCIDAGHGGNDDGCNCGSRKEKNDVLQAAEALQTALEALGAQVIMTRTEDVYVELENRVKTANDADADYLISIHRNEGQGYGVETWVSVDPTDESRALGQSIQDAMVDVGVQRNRGLKEGTQEGSGNSYYVIRCSEMPACLIELGFINDPTDNSYFDSNLTSYASGIAQAIIDTAKTYGKYS